MNINDLYKALLYGFESNKEVNPLFIEAKDTSKWEEVKKSPFYSDDLKKVIVEGERLIHKPITSLPYTCYKLFDVTGSRKEFEKEYFERRLRLNTFAILTILYGEQKYIDALQDTIWAISDEYTWCLPAHLGGNSLKIINNLNDVNNSLGNIKPQIREHKHTIDLFSSETGFALSEILNLVGDKLDELVVYRAKKEINERILVPYTEINKIHWWEISTNNWAAVCAASVGATAMYLIEDNAILAPILTRVIGTMECFLSGYKDDGVCTEGVGYWNYGFGFFTSFSELLRQRTASKIDLFKDKKVKEISLFLQKCYLNENMIISFSDSGLQSNFNVGLVHYLKRRYNEVQIPDLKYRGSYPGDNCYRWALAIRNFVWSDPSYEGSGLKDLSYYLKESEWFMSRKIYDQGAVCFAAKGGNNGEPHNHNDVGTFIFHVDGDSLLVDTGMGEYTKEYFGPNRYDILCNGSKGHSVPIIDGKYQKEGEECKAKYIASDFSEYKDSFTVDISEAYRNNNLKSLIRKFDFIKIDNYKLTLTDSFIFNEVPKSIVDRFVSFNYPLAVEEGLITIKGTKGSISIKYDTKLLKCKIEKSGYSNPSANFQELYLIDLEVINPTLQTQVLVQISKI